MSKTTKLFLQTIKASLLDLSLSYVGITYLGYKEGNPLFATAEGGLNYLNISLLFLFYFLLLKVISRWRVFQLFISFNISIIHLGLANIWLYLILREITPTAEIYTLAIIISILVSGWVVILPYLKSYEDLSSNS